MTDSRILPSSSAILADGNGRATLEYYRFFRNLANNFNLPSQLRDQLNALASRVSTLEDEDKGAVLWQLIRAIPANVLALGDASGGGLFGLDAEGNGVFRSIAGTDGQVEVENGDAAAGNPTLSLADTGVTAGVYGDTNHLPQITVDAQGRLTGVELISITGTGGGVPYEIMDGQTYTVPERIQALWTIPIDIDGTGVLDVGGILAEMS